MEKEIVYERITKERDYQDHMCIINEIPTNPTVEGELVMLKTYVDKALPIWTKKQSKSNEVTLAEIRKIAAIAIRCLENHGCPKRDMMKGILNGD